VIDVLPILYFISKNECREHESHGVADDDRELREEYTIDEPAGDTDYKEHGHPQ